MVEGNSEAVRQEQRRSKEEGCYGSAIQMAGRQCMGHRDSQAQKKGKLCARQNI